MEGRHQHQDERVVAGLQEGTATRHRRGYVLAFLGLPLLVTCWLYWPTLSQPFFWDDAVHFPYVMSRSVLQLWTSAEGLASYYRPIPSTLYKLLVALQPLGSTTAAHVLVLVVHTANAWLTGCLTHRLLCPTSGRTRLYRPVLGTGACNAAALLAALFVACYPYAALPVAHVAAIMHPLVTLLILGTTLAALRYVRANRIRWFVIGTGLAVLAPFAHELGIMAGAIALLVVALDDWPSARRHWRLLCVLPLASAVFLPIWLLVPKQPSPFSWLGLGDTLASTTFFTQGLTFPLQPLSRLLIDWLPALKPSPLLEFVGLPWWVIAAMWGVCLVAVGVASVALLPERRWRIVGVAVGWILLAALPSILVLPFPYITVSQRLLYASAPGAAVLWAAACVSLATRARRPAVRIAVTLAVAASIVAVPVLYVQRQMALHDLALQPLNQLAGIARTYPAEKHLVINPVNWVNYRNPWYALGHEGVSVSAPYIEFATLVWLNSGTSAQFRAATFPTIKTDLQEHSYSTIGDDRPWSWVDAATLSSGYDRVWITYYTEQAITIEEVGSVRHGAAQPPVAYIARFGDGVFLTSANVEAGGSMAAVNLDWKVLDGLAEATIFRHVYDCEGNMLAQGDGFALGRTLRFELLAPGSEVHDRRQIAVGQVPRDACVVVRVGLYLPDGTRVPALREDGSSWENHEVLLSAP